ncbi:MAG TPA: nucleotidyltransferase family protein [Casimicrobiaceae bacterium]|nr:nucleotidyltransferase family protein [Casimicrobiaceae bacterium]
MVLAAGRGERMRPLSDATPKPLLAAGGKPLLAWQVEALARAGFRRIVVNVAHLSERFVAAFGDGAALGVKILWSFEPEPLEAAGGIATALPLLPEGPALIVSGDIHTAFDYSSLRPRAEAMKESANAPRVHLVMVDNPVYHRAGDFALIDGRIVFADAARRTFANIGLYDTALFRDAPRMTRLRLLPYFQRWIAEGIVSGEYFSGHWTNVGTPQDLAALDRALDDRASGRPA